MRRHWHWYYIGGLCLLLITSAGYGGATHRLPVGNGAAPTVTLPPQPPVAATQAPSVVSDDPCQATLCALNPAVTQATIGSTICASGWTRTVRPPASYTGALKAQQMQQLGLAGAPADYEEDHRVPLELGGAPSDPHNLTPQKRAAAGGTAEGKDSDENAAKTSVCNGSKTLRQAQSEFIAKWLAPWPGYRQ